MLDWRDFNFVDIVARILLSIGMILVTLRLIFSSKKRREQTSFGLRNAVEIPVLALRSLLLLRLNWLLRDVIEFFEVDSGGLRAGLGPLAAEESADTGTVKGDDKGSPGLNLGPGMLS